MATHHPRTTVVTSGGTLVNEVIYPYPCIVHSIHVAHATGGAAWVQVHDVSSAPPNGAVPTFAHEIASAQRDAVIEGGGFPLYFRNGVYVCESDTVATKTLHAGLDLFVTLVVEEASLSV